MPRIRAVDVQPVCVFAAKRQGYEGTRAEDRFVRTGRQLSLLAAEWLQANEVSGSRARYGMHYLSPEMGQRVGQSALGVMRSGVRRSDHLVNVVVPHDFHQWSMDEQRGLLLDAHVAALDVLGELGPARREDLRALLTTAGHEHVWVSPSKVSRRRTLEARLRFRTGLDGFPAVSLEYRMSGGDPWAQVKLEGMCVPTLEAYQKYGRALRVTENEISVDTSKGTIFLPYSGVITVRLGLDERASGGRDHVQGPDAGHVRPGR